LNWLFRGRLLVIAYHGIYDDIKLKRYLPNTFVHIDDMVKQLRLIKEKYNIISPDELLNFLECKTILPSNAALITFDDGYESFYHLAAPILNSLGIKVLVFLPTYYVEKQEPYWFDITWYYITRSTHDQLIWLMNMLGLKGCNGEESIRTALLMDRIKRLTFQSRCDIVDSMKQVILLDDEANRLLKWSYAMNSGHVRDLADHGTIFGGHGHTHTILSVMSDSAAEKEILENKKKLEKLSCRPCRFFAYPNGSHGDFTDSHKIMLKRVGYKGAFSLTEKRFPIHGDVMDIPRTHISPDDTITSLMIRFSGMSSLIRQLSSRSRE